MSTSHGFASCSCPSWNANTDEPAIRKVLASLNDCSSSLHFWLELATFLVVVGVALEMVFVIWEYREDLHDFKRGLIQTSYAPEKPNVLLYVLGFLGAALVALGVGGELYAESKIATVETCIRKGNDTLFLVLSKEVGDAATSAKTAHEEAHGTHLEVDSLGGDIRATKEQANAAESHIAGALKQAVDATAELNRLKSPRSLVNVPKFIASLKPFAGTEYTFSSVFGDEESVDLLKQIDGALTLAGWKRVHPPSGFPAWNIYGRDVDFPVPQTVRTGIEVSVDSAESLSTLQALEIFELPSPVKEAVNLRFALESSLSPAESKPNPVNTESGSSKTVRIMVGKKP